MAYLKSDYINEEKVDIKGIPSIIFRPRGVDGLLPTIIHYHGWSSNKERQRMRAYIFASMGYQVILPDAINHGERNPLDNYDAENAIKYFWDTVFQNVEESEVFIDELIAKYKADPKRIGIMGHSMGGITATGVFVHDSRIKSLVILNGAAAWSDFNEILKENLIALEDFKEVEKLEDKISRLDPMEHLKEINNRPMIILHGVDDNVVPIKTQEFFYEKVRKIYNDKRKVKIMKYLHVGHYITTNMLEDALAWLDKHL